MNCIIMVYKREILTSTITYQIIVYLWNIMLETVTSRLSVIANLTVDCMCYTVWVFLQGKVICPYMKDYMTRVTFTSEWLDLVIPAIYIWKNSWQKLFIFCVIFSCVCDFPSLYVLEHTISQDEYFLLFPY